MKSKLFTEFRERVSALYTLFLYSIGHNKTVPTMQTSDSLESRHTEARLHCLLYHKILGHFNVAHWSHYACFKTSQKRPKTMR